MYRVTLAFEEQTFLFPFLCERVVIGSGDEVDLQLPVTQVSRRHAELIRTGEGFVLRDLGSRNGTFVKGLRIDEVTIEPLREFSLGPVIGMIEEISTTDLETAMSLDSLPLPTTEGPRHPGHTDQLSCEQMLLDELIAPLLDDLRSGCEPSSIARHGGRLVVDLFPGTAVTITEEIDNKSIVRFSSGVLTDQPSDQTARLELQSLSDSLITATWRPPPTVDMEPLQRALSFLLSLLATTTGADPAACSDTITAEPALSRLVCSAPAMLSLLTYARRLAPLPINLLILGESGTGKELLAREIHDASALSDRAFVAINCAALPRDLLEAELFGIEERVATGVAARPGRFEQAHNGTLFLDEVCDMSLETQAMILRVLQEKSFYRIGGDQPRPAVVRVLSATNKSIDQEIEAGRFRRDLYYRLAGDTLMVPRLADRPGDVALLVHHFLEQFSRTLERPVAGISRKALDCLVRHSWPGNVRELENEMQRLVALAPSGGLIEAGLLSPRVRSGSAPGSLPPVDSSLPDRLAAVERRLIIEALAAEDGNVAAASRRLGISRPGLYQRMERLDIDK
jgi:DNA-binding NtrC family response regulator